MHCMILNKAAKISKFHNMHCVGCFLCYVVCPVSAITVTEHRIGIITEVNKNKCIGCGLCLAVCPLHSIQMPENLNNVRTAFRGFSLKPDIYYYGASGGIVGSILWYLFDKKYIDAAYVAFYDSNMNIYGDVITSKEDVIKHLGSYYLQPKYMVNIKKINKYGSVAFIGLPCHVEALKNYLKLYNDKLNIFIVISLFCTIGRMRTGLIEFLKYRFGLKLEDLEVDKHLSRYGLNRLSNISIALKSGVQIKYTYKDYLDYVDYFYTPIGCFNCRKMFGLSADISVGDDWGIKTDRKLALGIANSIRGLALIEELAREKIIHVHAIKTDETPSILLNSQPIGKALKIYRPAETKFLMIMLKSLACIFSILRVPKRIMCLFRSLVLLYLSRRSLRSNW